MLHYCCKILQTLDAARQGQRGLDRDRVNQVVRLAFCLCPERPRIGRTLRYQKTMAPHHFPSPDKRDFQKVGIWASGQLPERRLIRSWLSHPIGQVVPRKTKSLWQLEFGPEFPMDAFRDSCQKLEAIFEGTSVPKNSRHDMNSRQRANAARR